MSDILSKTQQAFEAHTGYPVDHLVLRDSSTGEIEVGFAHIQDDEMIINTIGLPIEVLEKRSIELLFADVLATIVNQVNGDEPD